MSYLRRQGVVVIIYIDDILCIGKTFAKCTTGIKAIESTLLKLGFLINYKKSDLTPSNRQKFLGFIYNTRSMIIELPDDNRLKILAVVKKFQCGKKYKIREFAEMLGFLVSCCPAVKYGLAHTKNCERLKFKALLASNDDYNRFLVINVDTRHDLDWWAEIGAFSTNPIRDFEYKLEIYSDASLLGWGIFCDEE